MMEEIYALHGGTYVMLINMVFLPLAFLNTPLLLDRQCMYL